MSSPSALLKVNYLVIRHLHFRNARGDLQEGHVYAKRLRGYAFRSHFSLCSSTKMPILCSKCPKMRVPDPKSAQKLRFCARIGQKRGFQTPKAHKNSDFVLEMPEIGGSKGKKRTKTPILCSKSPKTGVSDPKSAQKLRFCARIGQKRGVRSQTKHKNAVFVLEKASLERGEGKRMTVWVILFL